MLSQSPDARPLPVRSLIPAALREEVQKDNTAFQREISDWDAKEEKKKVDKEVGHTAASCLQYAC